jgi:lysyl oxidase
VSTRKSVAGVLTPARTLVVTSVVGVVVALLSLMVVQAASRPAHAAADRLPDLEMARFKALQTQRTNDGRRLLRFSSIIVNVGAGRRELRGWRRGTGTNTMKVKQMIYNDAGGYRDARTGALMYFAGGRDGDDGHYHWHVRNLQKFKLMRLDNGRKVGTIAKHGFCFFDNYRYGSNRAPFYTAARGACGDSSSDLRVRMGLSRGWGDIYRWNLRGQYINITGLSPGRYRLKGVADPAGWFREKNNANNSTWVNLQLTRHGVRVLKHGPGA